MTDGNTEGIASLDEFLESQANESSDFEAFYDLEAEEGIDD